jgi:hypothetical protein
MARPFDHVLRLPGAQPEDFALAIAAEFAAVDPAAAHERLDRLALGLGPIAGRPAADRALALVEALAVRRGFGCDLRSGPEGLLLDRVLARRRGHPLALAIVYGAVARRLGFELVTVGAERLAVLADPSSTPTVVFDPSGRMRQPPPAIRWLCPHVVGTMMLEALATRYLERGEIRTSIRALELATALPLGPPLRARVEVRLTALRARLN